MQARNRMEYHMGKFGLGKNKKKFIGYDETPGKIKSTAIGTILTKKIWIIVFNYLHY